MFFFALEVIVVSILVSLFASWVKLVPRYSGRMFALIQQLLNGTLITLLVTLLFQLEIYPSWFLLFLTILFALWISVRITNNLVREAGQKERRGEGVAGRT
jgi:hypothetical protein